MANATRVLLCLCSILLFTGQAWSRNEEGVVKDHQGCAAFEASLANHTSAPRSAIGTARAGWEALGPFGGDVSDVAASPNNTSVVLAGLAPSSGSGTLYRSTDSAATWTEVAALSGNSVYDIEFAPGGIAYLGTLDAVWKSLDDGATWTQLNLNIGLNDQVMEVTVDPNDPTVLWIGVADAIGSQPVNVMKSKDSGATWTDQTPAMGSAMTCTGIAVDPTDSYKIIAVFGGGFGGGQAWVSADGGRNWTDRTGGLPGNPMTDAVHDGSRILVCGGKLFGSQYVGLYTSSNDGATWTELSDGTWPSTAISDIDLDPNDINTLYVSSFDQGAFRSTDGGATWAFNVGGSSSLALNEVSFEPGSSSNIYLGATSNAVWKSTDSGASFNPSSVGMGQLNVESIASNPNNPDELAIAFQGLNNGGVYSSLNSGLTWSLENLPGTRFNTVRFAPNGTLYALSDGPTTIATEGLYRRDGATWTSLGPDQGPHFEAELFAMAFSKNNPNLILTGGADFGTTYGFEATIWVSTDAGASWSKNYEGIDNEDIQDIEIIEDGTDQKMIAVYTDYGSDQTGGAVRSINGGVNWVAAGTGLPTIAQCTSLSRARVDDVNTYYLSDDDYGTGNGGVYKTTDGGATWASTGYVGRTHRVAAHPYVSGVVYSNQYNTPEAVWISVDGGATFSPFNAGLGSVGTIRDLQFKENGCELMLTSSTGSYATEVDCPLMIDTDTLSESTASQVNFTLTAGVDQAGENYYILGGVSGVEPGFPLPGGLTTLPLNWDVLTDIMLPRANTPSFVNFKGVLDGAGNSTALLDTLGPIPPGMVGVRLYFAYLVYYEFDFVSNPVMVDIVP